MKIRSEIRAGALLSYVVIILNTIVNFALTPFLLKELGKSDYGIYLLIGSISGYLLIMDLGVNTTIIRYISKYRAEGTSRKINKFLSTVFSIYSVLAITILAIGYVLYTNMEVIFSSSIEPNQLENAKLMLFVTIVNVSLTLIMNAFPAIINAYQKFVFSKILDLTRILIRVISIFIFISFGYSAVAIVVIDAILNIILMLARILYVRYKLNVSLTWEKPELKYVKEIFNFSTKVFLSSIINQVNTRLDQFILGIVSTASQVAISGIAASLNASYHALASALSGLFLPKITEMVSKGDSIKEIQKYTVKVSRLQSKVLLLITSSFVIYGKEFIVIWIGMGYEGVYWVVVILMIANILPFTQGVLLSLTQALNMHGFRNLIYLFITIGNIFLTILLGKSYGAVGAAAATGGTMILGYSIFIQGFYHYKIGLNMWKYMFETLFKSIPSVIAVLFTGLLLNQFFEFGFIGFIIKVLITTLFYCIIVWIFDTTQYEKKLIKEIIGRLTLGK